MLLSQRMSADGSSQSSGFTDWYVTRYGTLFSASSSPDSRMVLRQERFENIVSHSDRCHSSFGSFDVS